MDWLSEHRGIYRLLYYYYVAQPIPGRYSYLNHNYIANYIPAIY